MEDNYSCIRKFLTTFLLLIEVILLILFIGCVFYFNNHFSDIDNDVVKELWETFKSISFFITIVFVVFIIIPTLVLLISIFIKEANFKNAKLEELKELRNSFALFATQTHETTKKSIEKSKDKIDNIDNYEDNEIESDLINVKERFQKNTEEKIYMNYYYELYKKYMDTLSEI